MPETLTDTPALVLLATCLAALLAIVVVGALAAARNHRFTANYDQIRSETDLDAFRRLARRDMYASLVVIALSALYVIAGIALGFLAGFFSFLLLLIVFGPFMVVFGAVLSWMERRVKHIPCATETLDEQKRQIIDCWDKRPLPNF